MNFSLPISNNPLKTREDVEEALQQIIAPLKSFFSPGCSQVKIGFTGACYSEEISFFEAFARPLWGIVPFIAGGSDTEFLDIYIQGLKNGTDPQHKEYWGDIGDYDQRMVEMAAIGFALALIPEKIWPRLSEIEKKNLSTWLFQINKKKVVDNNWLFFIVLVNLGLKNAGAEYDQEEMNRALSRIDEFYLSDGWYVDGINYKSDYYIPFAMHFYGLIYGRLMKTIDPERSTKYVERAKLFAKDFIYWFSEDGSAVSFGRSLTYRFAQTAFWSALAYAEVDIFSWGIVKGIILRNLRWWFQQPIFSSDGLLTIGYAYPNLIMSEGYNASGSPYWALKTLLILALDKDHPFWLAEEEALPDLNHFSVQKHAKMLISRPNSRDVFMFTSGQGNFLEHAHASAKYSKFVYSNIFSFSVPKGSHGLAEGAFDSTLALSEGDDLYRVRTNSVEFSIEGNAVYSKWFPWNDVQVETWLIVTETPWHVRIHHIKTERNIHTAEGGFAIRTGKDQSMASTQNSVVAFFPWGISGIINLHGDRAGEIIRAEPNTNLLHPRTVIPTLKGSLQRGEHWMICCVIGSSQLEGINLDLHPTLGITKDSIEIYSDKKLIFGLNH